MAGAKDRDDGDTRAMLYDGASMSQLSRLFGMDMRDVSKKLRNVQPCGERRGFPIYNVREAAQALLPPVVDEGAILTYISSMNFKDLPPALNKEVWNGLRARLRFEQEQGDLWRTDRVQFIVNKLMQTIRMGVLLMPDRLARIKELTPEMHELLCGFADQTLADMQQQIVEAMQGIEIIPAGIMDYTETEIDSATTKADELSTVVEDYDDL